MNEQQIIKKVSDQVCESENCACLLARPRQEYKQRLNEGKYDVSFFVFVCSKRLKT